MGNAYYKLECSNAFVKMVIKAMESINAKVIITRIHKNIIWIDIKTDFHCDKHVLEMQYKAIYTIESV